MAGSRRLSCHAVMRYVPSIAAIIGLDNWLVYWSRTAPLMSSPVAEGEPLGSMGEPAEDRCCA